MKKVHQAIGCRPSIALAILRTGVGFGWRPYLLYVPTYGGGLGVGFREVKTARHEVNVLHCRGAGWQYRRKPSKRKVHSQILQARGPTAPDPARTHEN